MSTVTLSHPHCAITSAENPEGIASHPLTAALPAFHRSFSLLSATPFPFRCRAISPRHREGNPSKALVSAANAGQAGEKRTCVGPVSAEPPPSRRIATRCWIGIGVPPSWGETEHRRPNCAAGSDCVGPVCERGMKPAPFDYQAPATLRQAVELLASDLEAMVIAGGQSLMPLLALRLATPSLLVDLRRIPGLDAIAIGDDGIRLGARVRWRDIEDDPRLETAHPLLRETITHVAHYQIRNRGTVGGSLAHTDPAAELPGRYEQ